MNNKVYNSPRSSFTWADALRGMQKDKDVWMVRALALSAQLTALGSDCRWLLSASKDEAYQHMEKLDKTHEETAT